MTVATTLFQSAGYLRGKRDILLAIKKAKAEITSVKKSTSEVLSKVSKEIGDVRGRPLFYPEALMYLEMAQKAETTTL